MLEANAQFSFAVSLFHLMVLEYRIIQQKTEAAMDSNTSRNSNHFALLSFLFIQISG